MEQIKAGVYVKYKFSELVDINHLNSLIESFRSITGIGYTIKEITNGDFTNIISSKICCDLYNVNEITKIKSKEYQDAIMKELNEGKDYVIHKCNSGLVKIIVPIIIKKVTVAVIISSHMFFEEPNIEHFKNKALDLGVNEDKYIETIRDVPVVSNEKIKLITDFIVKIGKLLTEMGCRHLSELEANKKLSESYLELSGVYQQLRAAEQQLRNQYDELEKMAYYDPLTSLPNWNYIQKEIAQYSNKNGSSKLAIMYIDLDNFRNINNGFGHHYGDKLLQEIGRSLQKVLGNNCIVSRAGGDEFLIVQHGVESRKEALKTVGKVSELLNSTWQLEEKEFFVSASIGIAVFPEDGQDFDKILRSAEIAVNKAKQLGKNSYMFFEKSLYDEISRKTEMEKELRTAIKNEELTLHYQPQVDIKTGKIVSLEALLRWNSKKFGWVSPYEFIKLAEETGLIIPIGQWVLKTACLQNKDWKSKGYDYEFISVNVSVTQIQNRNFLDTVKEILKETGTKPEYLELEITESVMMETIESNLRILNELRSMGIRIALDDFGTGYSSLNYLKSLPINTLKLDKSFIDGLCKNSYEELITYEIIKLAHRMDLDVTAEGVEFEDQLKSLMEKECNRIQGYYFSKPFPPIEIESVLEKGSFSMNSMQ